MAPILLRAVKTDCVFNLAALRPAYPIKRLRARREHRHPKASKPGKSLPLDPLNWVLVEKWLCRCVCLS